LLSCSCADKQAVELLMIKKQDHLEAEALLLVNLEEYRTTWQNPAKVSVKQV
jgi:hypothetical protein